MMRTGGISPQAAETAISNAMTTSVVEKAENAPSAGNNRVCSDKENRENRCSNSIPSTEGRVNPYAMEVNRERNYYACNRFGHIAQHYRNRGGRIRIGDGRRLEYRQKWEREGNYEQSNNLKEEENLEPLD